MGNETTTTCTEAATRRHQRGNSTCAQGERLAAAIVGGPAAVVPNLLAMGDDHMGEVVDMLARAEVVMTARRDMIRAAMAKLLDK